MRRLEELSAARVRDLTAPGQVLLRLARQGFGVTLDGGPDTVVGGPAVRGRPPGP